MGMDASVSFFYGVKLDGDYELVERLREKLEWLEETSPWEWNEEGNVFELIWPCEGSDPSGFGVVLYSLDWDDTPSYTDVHMKIVDRYLKVVHAANKVFDREEIPGERDIYVQTRYW